MVCKALAFDMPHRLVGGTENLYFPLNGGGVRSDVSVGNFNKYHFSLSKMHG